MADTRSHRGPDPLDGRCFGREQLPTLQSAGADLCWLLERGYAEGSALTLVGNRYSLTARQRQAVRRSSCSDSARQKRGQCQVLGQRMAGQRILIDGFNILTTAETALGGGVVFLGRDLAMRDIAGLRGTYRPVVET